MWVPSHILWPDPGQTSNHQNCVSLLKTFWSPSAPSSFTGSAARNYQGISIPRSRVLLATEEIPQLPRSSDGITLSHFSEFPRDLVLAVQNCHISPFPASLPPPLQLSPGIICQGHYTWTLEVDCVHGLETDRPGFHWVRTSCTPQFLEVSKTQWVWQRW